MTVTIDNLDSYEWSKLYDIWKRHHKGFDVHISHRPDPRCGKGYYEISVINANRFHFHERIAIGATTEEAYERLTRLLDEDNLL